MRAGLAPCAMIVLLTGVCLAGEITRARQQSDAEVPRLTRAAASLDAEPPGVATVVTPTADFQDIPSREIRLGSMLPKTTSNDTQSFAFGRSDGSLVVLIQEDFRLLALRSVDGGTTFGSPTTIAGGPGQAGVTVFQAIGEPTGEIHVLIEAADTGGGTALQVLKSPNMGQTWTSPLTLIGGRQSPYSPFYSRVAARNGLVAILTFSFQDFHPYVLVSVDDGATWNGPTRADPGLPDGPEFDMGDIAIDGNGTIHTTFGVGSFQEDDTVWYARSTDGGISFTPPFNLKTIAVPSGPAVCYYPSIAITNDNAVIIAFLEILSGQLLAARSADGGVSFHRVLQETESCMLPIPHVHIEPGTSTILIASTGNDSTCPVTVRRSSDNGKTFGAPSTLSPSSNNKNVFYNMAGIVRTQSGRWAIAWTDTRSTPTDIYTSVSNDDGVTWGDAVRVDTDAPSASESILYTSGITTSLNDRLFLVWSDQRGLPGGTHATYTNDSLAEAPDFSQHERRIDHEVFPVNQQVGTDPTVATDNATHSYAAFRLVTISGDADIYVAGSGDGGRTFSVPRKVGGPQAGPRNNLAPAIRALPDGRVYLVYYRVEPGAGSQIRVNRSVDFGQTWQPDDLIVWTGASVKNLQIDATLDGRVYLCWSDGYHIYFARSTDSGANFTTSVIDQDTTIFSDHDPSMCAQGLEVLVVWQGLYMTQRSTLAVRSVDGGESWETRLPVGSYPSSFSRPQIACGASGEASAFWTGNDSGLWTSHFSHGSWLPAVRLDTPPQPNIYFGDAKFTDPSNLVVAYRNSDTTPGYVTNAGVFLVRSADGGLTFQTRVRLNDAAPSPSAYSYGVHLGTDGNHAVWAQWLDGSAGIGDSIAARCSTDGGATWGPVLRMNREEPQGGRYNSNFLSKGGAVATFPRTALFIWAGSRESSLYDAIVNSWSLDDLDRDGVVASADCLDSDPDVWQPPVEVHGVSVHKAPSVVEVSWSSQRISAGPETHYDVVTGIVGELMVDRDYSRSTCLVAGQDDSPYRDTRPSQEVGSAVYYLVRAVNVCATGSYGDSGLSPDPRDYLDAHGPCP